MSDYVHERADPEKLYESNWHDADPREYLEMDTFYLNLLMEMMAGPQNENMIGRLPRKITDLRRHIFVQVLTEQEPELADDLAVTDKILSLDWLLLENTRKILQNNKEVLLTIYDQLPPVLYTNQIVGYDTGRKG